MGRILVLLLLGLTAGAVGAEPSPVSRAGVDLIVKYEVGGPDAYTRKYRRPICPACMTTASGVTIGIGYDLRHQSPTTILTDWAAHPQRHRLPAAHGLGGSKAVQMSRALQDVITPLPLAMDVLQASTLPRYWATARRAFGPGFVDLPQPAQDALTSLVYNRGGSTVGPARAEYRVIRDQCVPRRDTACIADQIRAMTRLWRGSTIEAGMTARRNEEAAMAARDAR